MPRDDPGWQRQRAQAERNQEAIIEAAARLFRQHGVDAVEVRDIAAEAGVGVGTVYRRFGSKGNVIAAVIGDEERELQDALLRGPPPLGPGAPPRDRLVAFLDALGALTEANLELLAASEGSAHGARYTIGAYKAWRLHATVLLGDLNAELDAEWLADLLLAPLGSASYHHQRRDAQMPASRILDNLHRIVDLLNPAA